jgi:outer membrane protein
MPNGPRLANTSAEGVYHVNRYSTAIGAVLLGALALTTYSHSQTTAAKPAASVKIAVVSMRDAMLATKDGQKAGQEMQTKFGARRAALEKMAQEITAEARQKPNEDLSAKKKKYDREMEDLNAEMQAENNRLLQEITNKFGKVLDQYAKANGYTVVMDAEQPLLWAAESANVTPDLIKAYDQAHPAAAATPTPAPAQKK